MVGMELDTIKDAFGRATKKQKLCSSKSLEVIDQVCCEIQQALVNIQSCETSTPLLDQESVLAELKHKINTISPLTRLDGLQKELNMIQSKYTKILEKTFDPDISKACRIVDFDLHLLNQIMVSHFYRLGLFDIGDCLINEAGETGATAVRSHFLELHQILEAIKVKNLGPALHWVSNNRNKLRHIGSDLELKLHRLQFLEILKTGSRDNALNYAKTCLAPLSADHMIEMQKLMVCVCWIGKLERFPYPELLDPIHWENISDELHRDFCNVLGYSCGDLLIVAITAGIEGLPTLLKLADVMAVRKQEWEAMKQLPVPVELRKEYQFHSIFVCPVSREEGSDENPPMLMPCLHVLSKQSIAKLSKNSTRMFKCPYCPAEVSPMQAAILLAGFLLLQT